MRKFTVELRSGRSLDCVEDGDPEGVPLFVLHGTPGSRRLFSPQVEHARKNGIRLVSYSRPGYGNSSRNAGRKIADAVPDIEEIADVAGIEKFAVMGHSGGGPHALACGALLPERTKGIVSVAGVGPYGAEGLDFTAGMGEYNVEDFNMLMKDEKKWEENNIRDTEMLLNSEKDEFTNVFGSLMSEPDRKAMSDELIDYLMGQAKEGCTRSIYGLKDDNLAFMKNWGFGPESISVPVQLWQGTEDKFVPFSHGKWLSQKIPECEAHLEQGEGHLSIFASGIPEIHKWVSNLF